MRESTGWVDEGIDWTGRSWNKFDGYIRESIRLVDQGINWNQLTDLTVLEIFKMLFHANY